MNIKSKKQGFTLAETLITMGIIGLLGVLLVPLIKNTTTNQNKVLFRKAYGVLAAVIDDLLSNTSTWSQDYPASAVGTDSNGAGVLRAFNYTAPHYNLRSGYSTGGPYYNKFCYFFFTELKAASRGDMLNTCPDADVPSDAAAQRTVGADGVTWYFYAPYADSTAVDTYSANTLWPLSPTAYTTKFTIDVNGLTQGTNCSADTGFGTYMPSATYHPANPPYSSCVNSGADAATNPCKFNPDTFIVGIRYDGKLQVGSGSGTDKCAEYILANPTDTQ